MIRWIQGVKSGPDFVRNQRQKLQTAQVHVVCVMFGRTNNVVMILPQVHLRKPCYDFYFL
jgi:hypothetical protein